MNRSSDLLQFEVKLRESRHTDPAFSFLNPADPYHAYYRHRLERATYHILQLPHAGGVALTAPLAPKVHVLDIGVKD
jgi:splicing factor 3A subunit 1